MAGRTSSVVRLTGNFQVSVPKRIREALGLQLGDFLDTSIENGAVVLRPKTLTDREVLIQQIQDDVAASQADIAAGRSVGPFTSADEVEAVLRDISPLTTRPDARSTE